MADVDDKALRAEVTALATQSTAVVVADEDSYAAAGAFLVSVAEKKRVVVDWFRPLKDAAHKAHKAICDREKQTLTPLETADRKVRVAISAYRQEQERIRRAEEARLAEEARKAEEARLAAQAAALESAGETAMAEAVLEQAIEAPAPIVVLESKTPKVDGVSYMTVWKWRPLGGDAGRAIQLVPREYLALDEKKLTAYVKAMKGAAKVPGIEFYSEDVPVVRSA